MNMEKIPSSENIGLEAFRSEIQKIKEDEARELKEEGVGSIHLTEVFSDELDSEDMDIWSKFKNKDLTKEVFDTYRKESEKDSSRYFFAAFVANKVMNWELYHSEENND